MIGGSTLMTANPPCEWCGETLGTQHLTLNGERYVITVSYVEADGYLFCMPCDKEASNA
jgi:hypothetical protein